MKELKEINVLSSNFKISIFSIIKNIKDKKIRKRFTYLFVDYEKRSFNEEKFKEIIEDNFICSIDQLFLFSATKEGRDYWRNIWIEAVKNINYGRDKL